MYPPFDISGATIISDRRHPLYRVGSALFSGQYLKKQDFKNVVELSRTFQRNSMATYWVGEAIFNHLFNGKQGNYKIFEILGIGDLEEIEKVYEGLKNKSLMKETQWEFGYNIKERRAVFMSGVILEKSATITPEIFLGKFRKKPSIINVGFSTRKKLEQALQNPTFISSPSTSKLAEVVI